MLLIMANFENMIVGYLTSKCCYRNTRVDS